MGKNKSEFVCQSCGAKFPISYGKCPSCSEWGSLVETVIASARVSEIGVGGGFFRPPQRLSEVVYKSVPRQSTGLGEFDRVLGGDKLATGFVSGQVVLLAGEPGIGKSTILLHLAQSLGKDQNNPPILYVAGEESPEQIKLRARRIGYSGENLKVIVSTSVEDVINAIESEFFSLVIVDSVQTVSTGDLSSLSGSVSQVRESASRLSSAAKRKGTPLILVGHVNKEGEIAGPKVLEHVVDTVLSLEGERSGRYRLLKAVKNRFGDPSEVGVFKMEESGFSEVPNAGALLLEEGSGKRAGSVVNISLEGNRPLLLEVQGLTSKTVFPYPRRSTTGYDLNRVYFLLAVLEKAMNVSFLPLDIFVNIAGGLKGEMPATDLAIILAIGSCYKNAPLPTMTAVFGEVGLSGEVRHVREEEKRTLEAKKLGFTNIIGPQQAKTVRQAIGMVFS